VLSYTEMLLSEPNAAHGHRELSEIKRAGQRAAELVRQLLAVSRKQAVAPPVIDSNRTRAAGAVVLEGESVSAPPERETLNGTETILLVDDDASVRGVARSILMKQGYTVITAAGAKEALLYAKHSAKIDLLVTDVTMPDTSGPVLARGLREVHPTLKVLFMSGYAESDIVHQGLLEPNSRYMQKPLTLSTFALKVRQVLDEEDPREPEPRQ
jgi:CheY-like chemotaxis protein